MSKQDIHITQNVGEVKPGGMQVIYWGERELIPFGNLCQGYSVGGVRHGIL